MEQKLITNTNGQLKDHPLKASEANFENKALGLNMRMLRQHEGLGAPLRIMMEMNAYKRVGHLSCLPSSRIHLDVITGRDEMIDFTDFLGGAEFSERLINPHEAVEKKFNSA